jgi:hypothetical protein
LSYTFKPVIDETGEQNILLPREMTRRRWWRSDYPDSIAAIEVSAGLEFAHGL